MKQQQGRKCGWERSEEKQGIALDRWADQISYLSQASKTLKWPFLCHCLWNCHCHCHWFCICPKNLNVQVVNGAGCESRASASPWVPPSAPLPLRSSFTRCLNPIYPGGKGAHCATFVTYLAITGQIHVRACWQKLDFSQLWVWKRAVCFSPHKLISFCREK